MEISSEAIVGIISTLLGTVVGWLLGFITNNVGRLIINFEDIKIDFDEREDYEITPNENPDKIPHAKFIRYVPNSIATEFVIVALNNKNRVCCINNCKVYLESSSERFDITDSNDFLKNMLSDRNEHVDENKFDSLLNIEATSAKKLKVDFHYLFLSNINLDQGYKICFEYNVIGRKKVYNKIIVNEKKYNKYVQRPTSNVLVIICQKIKK